jgi:Flp pilus assembly protein TadD
MTQGHWSDAIPSLEQVLQVSQAIGDSSLAASAHTKLTECWLELGDTDKAATHLQTVLDDRPADADMLRLQARLAAVSGDTESAIELMSEARIRAGEKWRAEDDELLENYRTRLPKPSQTSTEP